MTDTPLTPVDVTPSATRSQVTGQIRILLAVVAGVLVGKHILPTDFANDTVLDALSALITLGLAAGWQWFRTKLEHSRWWALANDPGVPDDRVRPATPKEK